MSLFDASVLPAWGAAPAALEIAKARRALLAPAAVEACADWPGLDLYVTGTWTFEPLVPALQVRAARERRRLTASVAPFGQVAQSLLDPAGPARAEGRDAVLVAARLADMRPELYEAFNSLAPADVDRVVADWQSEYGGYLETFRAACPTRLLLTSFELPAWPSLGYADASAARGQRAMIEACNAWLLELAARLGNTWVVDVAGLAARFGLGRFCDPRTWRLGRIAVAAEAQWDYAGEVLRVLRMATGGAKKVLALDCDNTLWGGVLGDVGRDGLQLGQDYPGNAYVALQRRALELQRRGVVLVLASKNDPAAVRGVLREHPEMVLREEHISYFAVDWNPKPGNLRQAAAALNLGLDSFVFLDDHPVECAMMRELAPEVVTVQLPEDPARFEPTLAALDLFDQPRVSAEDRRRGELYRAEAARADLKRSAGDLESFYRGLEMRMIIQVNAAESLARAAQLTQRTNQFNMTTVRRDENQLRQLIEQGHARLVTMRLIDRFGDNGIVGLAIVNDADPPELDTFLMSCRVLGRTVETTFLTWLARDAAAAGAAALVGIYRPTAKNKSFADFYRSSGWVEQSAAPGEQRWRLDLAPPAQELRLPDWLTIEEPSTP